MHSIVKRAAASLLSVPPDCSLWLAFVDSTVAALLDVIAAGQWTLGSPIACRQANCVVVLCSAAQSIQLAESPQAWYGALWVVIDSNSDQSPARADDCFDIKAMAPEACAQRLQGVLNVAARRHRLAQKQLLLAEIEEAVRPLLQPADITLRAASMLGTALRVNRCAYADVEADEDTFNLTGDYVDGVPSIVGRYRFRDFSAACLVAMRANEPFVVADAEIDPRTVDVRESFRRTAIRAVICVPMIRDGRFVAAMAVHAVIPRHWSTAEVVLVKAVAERCWESIERNRILRELRGRELRYRTLLDLLTSVVWHANADGTALPDNTSFQRFTGQTRDEVVGYGWLDAVHPADRASAKAAWEQVVHGTSEVRMAFRLRRHDGVYRDMLAHGAPITFPEGSNEWIGSCVDVTEERISARSLTDALTRLEFVLEAAAIAEWEIDLVDRSWSCSRRFDELFGYHARRVEWSTEQLCEHVHPDDRTRINELLDRALQEDRDWRAEFRILRHDHTTIWIEASGYIYHDEARLPTKMVGIFVDIAARKAVEVALREADQRKDEFLATLAHELRNPLGPIVSAAELLPLYAHDSSKILQASAVVIRQSKHMKALIDDLMDVSRVTRGLVTISRAPCDMTNIIREAIEQAGARLNEAKHQLQLIGCDEPVDLTGDHVRLVQVMYNLLANAIKYTPKGGHLVIRVDAQEHHLACTVSDNGIGMTPAFIECCFELFTQAQTDVARGVGGLGLGLALVKRIIEQHDGTVTARSEGIGLGTQVTFTLPRLIVYNLPGD